MLSSYEVNNFGDVLFSIATTYRPIIAVELGVLHGYSSYHLSRALQYNRKVCGLNGHLDSYDLFEDYEYKHGNKEEVEQFVKDKGVDEFVTFYKENAYEVHNKYTDNTVYLLHVDISNTGETVKKIMELWDPKMVQGGIILFEGGSEERDNIEWMIKYNKLPMKPEIENNIIINEKYVYGTYLKYPSLTCLLKKR